VTLSLKVRHIRLHHDQLHSYRTLDILLHHSGHIMLSDFDLAKHSGVIGGRPATIHQSELNGVIIDPFISMTMRMLIRFRTASSC
jgi:protein-serine/threonine kinase